MAPASLGKPPWGCVLTANDDQQDRTAGTSVGEPGPLSRLLLELADASGDDALEAWTNELLPGDKVGRFVIRREVGRGGFGAVYEALDTQLNRVVAVKTLRFSRKRRDLSSEWLKREAEAVARLDHPCIVTLFDVGTGDAGPYLVMELLRGRTLAQRIADGPVPQAEALRIAGEMAKGLAHAHQRGVLHRDLKPANVFLCEDGRVKLLDFGLAHLLGSPEAKGSGTPAYMPPEQARGDEIDARADVYAAAMVLREMLTGRRELGGDAVVPKVISGALERAMSSNRDSRPRDGTAWLEELAAVQVAPRRPRRAWRVAGLVALGLVLGVGALWFATRPRVGPPQGPNSSFAWTRPSIAVMPFADLSPNHDQAYFSEGIAEEILRALSRVQGMRVPGRSSSFWFKGKNVEPAEIARKLGVTYLLEGSVRSSGDRIRITAEVVNALTGERVWSEVYEREIADVFSIQDEIARSVVQAVAPVLRARSVAIPASPATNPEAYRLLLMGRYRNSQGTEESVGQAVDMLERSASLDPGYAPTQAMLAFAYRNLSVRKKGAEQQRLRKAAREATERAVKLDPSSAWAYLAQAATRLMEDLDWRGALASLDRATALDPSSPPILNMRGLFLASLGRLPEAVEVQRRAVEQDPLSAIHTDNLARFLLGDGRYAEAQEWYRRADELSPGGGGLQWAGAWTALGTGDPQNALALFEKMPGAERLMGTAVALHALGRDQESRERLAQLEREFPDAPVTIAGARAGRGDIDGAFESLEVAVRTRDARLWSLWYQQQLRPLRSDPRFPALMERIGAKVE